MDFTPVLDSHNVNDARLVNDPVDDPIVANARGVAAEEFSGERLADPIGIRAQRPQREFGNCCGCP